MSRRKNRPVIERAPQRTPNIRPGGVNFKPVTDTVIQGMYQHMGPQANVTTMFAPGAPIRPIPGLTPPGGPRGFQYPVGYNIAQLPRSTEPYSFDDLRNLAQMYYGIQMCEQVWFDYISKLELIIEPREELLTDNQDISKYVDDIRFYRDFFAFPDRTHDLHTWMQMAVRDQLEIDAVAIYVRKDRAGRPFSLDLIDGSMIKPLVDDRGRRPDPPFPAYEQFVYGVPACFLTTEDLIYVKETDRVESVYGRSRVEKIILNVNVALRKQTKDLSRFTDGNIPQGFLMPSMDVTWSQTEIEAYQMTFNNLMAGSDEERARIRILPRGFDYKPTEDPDIHVDLDQFLLNVCASNFGITMAELAFVADVNRSSGETQENVVYRRAMGPLMTRYARLLTMIMHKYFGESRFKARWKGFEEVEDFMNKATAYSSLTTSGILSPSRAAHLLNLPVDVDLPSPVFQTKTGIVLLKDLVDPEVQDALKNALMGAGDATPPDAMPQEGDEEDMMPEEGDQPDEPMEEELEEGEDSDEEDEGEEEEEEETEVDEDDWITEEEEEEEERLLRHAPGGVPHDQHTHGNWDHYGYASHDKTPRNKKAGLAKASGKSQTKAAISAHDQANKQETNSKVSGAKTKAAKSAKVKATKTKSSKTKTNPVKTSKRKPGVPAAVKTQESIGHLSDRMARDAELFAELADRSPGRKWTQARIDAAKTVSGLFKQISDAVKNGDGEKVDALLDKVLSLGVTVFGRNSTRYHSLSILLKHIDARMVKLGADRSAQPDFLDESPEERRQAALADLLRWKKRAVDDVQHGAVLRPFESPYLPLWAQKTIWSGLYGAKTAQDARAVFDRVRLTDQSRMEDEFARWEAQAQQDVRVAVVRDFPSYALSPLAQMIIVNGLFDSTSLSDVREVFARAKSSDLADTGAWQQIDPDVRKAMMKLAQSGVVEVEWSIKGGGRSPCDQCARNIGQKVTFGVPFATGAYLPPQHPNCECTLIEYYPDGTSKVGFGMNKGPSIP